MINLVSLIKRNKIENPPWNYSFLQNLDVREYPLYLAELFKLNTGENLPLSFDFKKQAWVIDKKRCKTFNQKIQWIKLYGVTPLMCDCTDKIKVRNYVKEKIGEEYLKPVLQMCDNFDEIDFEKLPNAFVLKCNHGCKWHYIIKSKNEFLNNQKLFQAIKQQMTGWLEQNFCWWGGFELQYLNIKPKILIEPLMREQLDKTSETINIYCFNGNPQIIIHFFDDKKMSIWDENFKPMENIFDFSEENIKKEADNLIKQAFVLSKQLAVDFCFVRVDWMIFKHRIYFEELTCTPYSGFNVLKDMTVNLKLGKLINIERI